MFIPGLNGICVCVISLVPAWLCVVSVPLSSVWTPSARRRTPARTSAAPPSSSSARSAPVPGSSAWGLDRDRDRGQSSDNDCVCSNIFHFSRVGAVTLFCVGAVQLSVQGTDDGGQVRAQSLLPQVHGDSSQELKHTRSLRERKKRKLQLITSYEC